MGFEVCGWKIASSQPNFNLDYFDESDDDNSETQRKELESSDESNVHDRVVENLDLESLLNSSQDSAIGSVASTEGTQNRSSVLEINEENNNVQGGTSPTRSPVTYCPNVEDISEPER